ncbi:MAG: ion transporter [Betaproteobacteria bacterium]|nr:ion transporter [Betaproteobacteria bacterium]NBY05405.1 ion transporter [Betaproteobacteria bacterium]
MEEPRKAIQISDLDAASLLGAEVEADISPDLPRRQWLYAWLLDPNIPGNYQKSIDKWIAILIVVNLFTMVLEQVPAIFEPYKNWFHAFDVFSIAVFVIEYLTRFFLAPEDEEFKTKGSPRLAYVFSPFAIIDLLAILPFFLQAIVPVDLRALRFLRLLRILKIFRILLPAWSEFKDLNRERTFRQKIHALVFNSPYGGNLKDFFDVFIGVWVLISVIAVVLESVASVSYLINIEFVILDTIAVAVFTIEYMMRIYASVEEPAHHNPVFGRIKQITNPSTFIDLLAILPFFLEVFLHQVLDLRFLRVFRLARLLKLTRGSDATATLFKVIKREWPVMSAAAFIMILLIVLTASLGYLFEHAAQPDKFENIPTAIYWAVITLASVGYGDISPVTPIGRAMTVVMALLGIGIFAIPAGLLASAFSDQLHKERDTLKADILKMLKDGQLDDEEIALLRSEAKRLHLTVEEMNHILEVLNLELENARNSLLQLPPNVIAQNLQHSIEHYKYLLSQISQLGIYVDKAAFLEKAKTDDRLTASEIDIWNRINESR